MGEEEPRFSVMLTRTEVETIIRWVRLYRLRGIPIEDHLIERLERRLRQRDAHEEQERRLSGDPSIDTGI